VWVALLVPATAGAAVTLGPPNPNPDPLDAMGPTGHHLNYPTPALLFNSAGPLGTQIGAPGPGVIVSWTYFTNEVTPGSSAQLRILVPGATAGTFAAVRSGPVIALDPVAIPPPALTRQVQHTFAANLPVAAGEIPALGLVNPGTNAIVSTSIAGLGWKESFFQTRSPSPPPPPDGGAATTPSSTANEFVAFNAVWEPDADGDTFGDESQDRCLGVAGTDRGCPPGTLDQPAVTTTVTAPAPPAQLPASALAKIDSGHITLAKSRRTLSVAIACPAQQARDCRGTLSAKTAKKFKRHVLSLGSSAFDVPQATSKTTVLKVSSATRKAIAKTQRLAIVLALTVSAKTQKTAR
jgi:hypothetical protein